MSDTYDIPSSALEGEPESNFSPSNYEIAPDETSIAEGILSLDPLTLPTASKMSDTIKVPELPPPPHFARFARVFGNYLCLIHMRRAVRTSLHATG